MLTQERSQYIDGFLPQYLNDYQRKPLAADASFRRYERIICGNSSYILMDAPPPKEEVMTFSKITQILRDIDLHAPEIIAADNELGFLLLEDLGGDSYTRHLQSNPNDEWSLYKEAIDVLLHLHKFAPQTSDLPVYDNKEYDRELRVFTDWYLPAINKKGLADDFLSIWLEILNTSGLNQNCMVLRDYHADNLMWMPEVNGLQKVGLLDYQDAILGDGAYDLVSLLEDARRDVSPETAQKAITYYCESMNVDVEQFHKHYAILGAQRNLKIIGVFNRLCSRDGKPHYLDYLPRAWRHLQNDMSHPALAQLNKWMTLHCSI